MKPVTFLIPLMLLIFTFYTCPALAATILVPSDLPTIQAGINAADPGDLVLVAPGTYVENIDFLGKVITLQSEAGAKMTVIDGNQAGSVVTFVNTEPEQAVLDGFTIRNGLYGYGKGGGVHCSNSSPTITNCMITENSVYNDGGGIYFSNSSATIVNCMITENSAEIGGGVYCNNSSLTILFCTIAGNSADNGGGIFCGSSSPTITNCIFWKNEAPSHPELHVVSASPVITYSDVRLGWPGEGNIDADPLFAGDGDYHIYLGSPCVDSGTDAGVYEDIEGRIRPLRAGFDMGAYEYPDCVDRDEDGYGDQACGGYDCDDVNPAINPGTQEICDNGIDDDCDGLIDLEDMPQCCWDHDGDEYSDEACGGTDCDDSSLTIFPGAPELCDGMDNGCNGMIPTDEVDVDEDGWMICEGDCDDSEADTSPGALDPCDGLDQNCDGTDGFTEICDNGVDDDCDGLIDSDDPRCAAILVPDDYPTIQAGIEAAADENLVLVAPGTYVENINFLGKAITLRSETGPETTVIDGSGCSRSETYCSVVTFNGDETGSSILDGFTIRNGSGTLTVALHYAIEDGGGIHVIGSSSPTIKNCIIMENSVIGRGGGIACSSSTTIDNCTIMGNSAFFGGFESGGGGIRASGSTRITNCTISGNYNDYPGGGGVNLGGDFTTITNCIISGNSTETKGGGILDRGSSTITNCTITNNEATDYGMFGGLYATQAKVTNCIFWNNSEFEIGGSPVVTFSVVEGGWPGAGNIDANPLFIGAGDYHLRTDSPCIDAGVEAGLDIDIDEDTRPYGAGFDLGADEYTGPRWALGLDAAYEAGSVSLDYVIWTPEPATWVNYLILTFPAVQVIPLLTVPLTVLAAPLDLPIAFPFPSLGLVGFYNGLFSAEGLQVYDLDWVDTGS